MSKTKDQIEISSREMFDDSEAPIGGYRYYDEKGQHLHTFEGKPLIGTSSVFKVIAKPLTWWASGKAVEKLGIPSAKIITKIKNKKATKEETDQCMISCDAMLSKIKEMSAFEYYKLLDGAYRAHQTSLKDSAEEGTDLHAELERFVKDEMADKALPESSYHARILPFIVWSRTHVAKYLWSEANCYSLKNWTGGISDVGLIDVTGKKAVFDFKSSKEAYQTQFWQCAGYDIQMEENGGYDAQGRLLFECGFKADYYAIVPFGSEVVRPYTNEEIGQQIGMDMSAEACRAGFLSTLDLYKRLPRE